MFVLRHLPRYDGIYKQGSRYAPDGTGAVESFLVLQCCSRVLFDRFEAFLMTHGMSQGKFTVMMLLNAEPERGLNPSELADRADVTRATMTGLLDGLEKENLVRRDGDPSDRRRAVVQLTTTGRSLLERVLPQYFKSVQEVMGSLGPSEQAQLTELLGRVRDRLLAE